MEFPKGENGTLKVGDRVQVLSCRTGCSLPYPDQTVLLLVHAYYVS
jgi:hypothetical protein